MTEPLKDIKVRDNPSSALISSVNGWVGGREAIYSDSDSDLSCQRPTREAATMEAERRVMKEDRVRSAARSDTVGSTVEGWRALKTEMAFSNDGL